MFYKKSSLFFFVLAFNTMLVANPVSVPFPHLFKHYSAYAETIIPGETEKAPCIDVNRTDNIQLLVDQEYYNTLMNDLSNARKNITVVMYLFKMTGYRSALPDHIINMLIKKHAQGVNVSVVLNIDRKNDLNEVKDDLNQTNLEVAKQLQSKGITVYLDSPQRTTHAKIVVIDDRIVYIGSHNFTQSALKYNHEVSVRIVSTDMADKVLHYVEAVEHEK
ncbi:MAG: phospholipase D-like domain-containing protein [bacterium]